MCGKFERISIEKNSNALMGNISEFRTNCRYGSEPIGNEMDPNDEFPTTTVDTAPIRVQYHNRRKRRVRAATLIGTKECAVTYNYGS
jgi:hypothetical protein